MEPKAPPTAAPKALPTVVSKSVPAGPNKEDSNAQIPNAMEVPMEVPAAPLIVVRPNPKTLLNKITIGI